MSILNCSTTLIYRLDQVFQTDKPLYFKQKRILDFFEIRMHIIFCGFIDWDKKN